MGQSTSRIFSDLFNKQEIRIMMLGLDGAGKTTLLYRLKLGKVIASTPTFGFNVESIEHNNVKLAIWDVGGPANIRALYKHYRQDTQGFILVVDSSDIDRIPEVQQELQGLHVRGMALLVFANKQDLSNALSPSELSDLLGLHALEDNKWFIQPTCVVTGDGLEEGLDWLTQNIRLQSK